MVANNAEMSSALRVLMWFYQLSGIMLSVTSPLDYLDGSGITLSIVSEVSTTVDVNSCVTNPNWKGTVTKPAIV